MRKTSIVLFLAGILILGSCNMNIDTPVAWGFTDTPDGEIINGSEQLADGNVKVLAAFDEVFYANSKGKLGPHSSLLGSQKSKARARKFACQLADQAHSKVDTVKVSVPLYLVVEIGYNASDSIADEVVWSRYYK